MLNNYKSHTWKEQEPLCTEMLLRFGNIWRNPVARSIFDSGCLVESLKYYVWHRVGHKLQRSCLHISISMIFL